MGQILSRSAPEASIPDEGQIVWEDAVSKNGKPYRIGRRVAENSEKDGVRTKALSPFGLSVDWPVGGKGWKDTGATVKQIAAITQYKCYYDKGVIFDYTLEITNTENYDYHFYDKEGDSYRINTSSKSNHYVNYNSKKPDIVFVTGS